MPPVTRITRELILQKSFKITQKEGIEALNARYLAKQLSCSTMPLFKVFNDMTALKSALKTVIDNYYDQFILAYLDQDNYLFTMSYGYICFALKERNLFGALFVDEFINPRTMSQVIDSPWNRETIEYCATQYHLSLQESEALYRDIRFYSHGIATQIYGGNIILTESEIQTLLLNAIEKFLK